MFRFSIAFLSVFVMGSAQAGNALFETVDDGTGQDTVYELATQNNTRLDKVQIVRFNQSAFSAEPGDVFSVPLVGRAPIELRYRRTIEHADGLRTWVAEPVDHKGFASLITVSEDGGLAGRVRTAEGVYELQAGHRSDPYEAALVNPSARQHQGAFCGTDDPVHAADWPDSYSAAGSPAVDGQADEITTLGVVVGYGNAPVTDWGDNLALEIQNYVDTANTAFEDSEAAVRLELRGSMWVGIDEPSVEFPTGLPPSIAAPSGPVWTSEQLKHAEFAGLRDLDALRNTTGSHLLAILGRGATLRDGICGNAFGSIRQHLDFVQLGSYTDTACSNDPALTFAHEIGHNLGAHHSPSDSSWENRTVGYIGSTFETVMSVSFSQPRIGQFSNPNLQCNGEPCGTETQDSARGMSETAPIIAQVREDTAGIIAASSESFRRYGERRFAHHQGALQAFDRFEFTGGWAKLDISNGQDIVYSIPRMPLVVPRRKQRLNMPLSLPPTRDSGDYTVTLTSPDGQFQSIETTFSIRPQAPYLEPSDGASIQVVPGETSAAIDFTFFESPTVHGEAQVSVWLESTGGTQDLWEGWPVFFEDEEHAAHLIAADLDCATEYTAHVRTETWNGDANDFSETFQTSPCGSGSGNTLNMTLTEITHDAATVDVQGANGEVRLVGVSEWNAPSVTVDAGDFPATLSGLQCGQDYRFRAIENGSGMAVSNEVAVATEACATPVIAMRSAEVEISGDQRIIEVTMDREDRGDVAADIIIRTHDGSALAGEHYIEKHIFVGWPPGDTASKTLKIPVHPNATTSQDRDFEVSLEEATSPFAAEVGDIATTAITLAQAEVVMPTADFSVSCDDLECQFDASESNPGSGTLESWDWDFGNGGTATGESVEYTFDSAGSYEVTLIIETTAGDSDEHRQEVTVTGGSDDGGEDDAGGSSSSGSSGGCSLSATSSPDPMLWLLAILAFAGIRFRHEKKPGDRIARLSYCS